MTDETGDTLYTYDRMGNLTSVDDSEGNTIGYTYDVAGNVSSITYPDGGKVSYEYDKNNNLTEVSDTTGKATRYSYDALNRVTLTERPNNINTSFTYDAEGRVTNLTNYNSLTKLKISSYSYTYDELGYITEEKAAEYLTESTFLTANPLTAGSMLMPYGWGRMNKSLADSLKEKNGGILPAITKTTKYTYDEDGKLTRAVEDGWRKAGIEYIYEYDAKGNRTYFEKREAGIAVEKAESTYDKADRLISTKETSVSDTGKTTVKTWSYTYDGDGNLISEESDDGTCRTEEYTYVYEAEDRLKAVYDPEGLVAAYTYDGDGNRVLELSYDTELKGNLNNKEFTTVNAAEAALTEYLGDEERALYEITRYINDVNREYTEVLMERDGSGALATAYVYGNERLSVRSTKKENGYYLYDGRGSVTNIVSILGERLESYSYDPSGRVMRATSTNRYQKTFYGYNAEGYDPKTGSVYLRARYYNTRTGSFNTKDTYLGSLMEPLSLNRYAYAQGNPVYYIDPSGHVVLSDGTTMVVEDGKCVFYKDGKVVETPMSGMPASESANIQTTISAIPDDYTGRALCGSDVNGIKHYYYAAEAYIKGVGRYLSSAPQWLKNAFIYNNLRNMGVPESVLNKLGYSSRDQLEYETMIARGETGAYSDYFDEGYEDGFAFYIIELFVKELIAIGMVYGGPYTTTAQYGDDFGKMGKYVENPNIEVDWSQTTVHGMDRMQQRGLSQDMVENIVQNGKALSQNGGNKFAFITQEGVAVVDKTGKLITAWTSADFDENMLLIIKALFGE